MNNEPKLNILDGETFITMKKPLVYAWCRKGVYLYIGATNKGFQRLFTHDKIGVLEPFLNTDRIDFWRLPTWKEAYVYEQELIRIWQPKYNGMSQPKVIVIKPKSTVKSQRRCTSCGNVLHPNASPTRKECWKCNSAKICVDMSVLNNDNLRFKRALENERIAAEARRVHNENMKGIRKPSIQVHLH